MRPYLVLTFVLSAAVLAGTAFAQQPYPNSYDGLCSYGCGPYIPRLTTPEIHLQQVSPNPVGASNATTGLIAGATNATLSEIEGSTSSVYTVPVWYQGGGAPLTTSQVQLWPERVGREGHAQHEPIFGQHPPQERPREARLVERRPGEEGPRENRMHKGGREEQAAPETARGEWTYFTGRETATESTSVVKNYKKAARVYGNDDVKRQNDKNGMVKYDGKTEKL
jgi:hypothetical protein